ncbi:hypothetical protein IGI49_003417 [Enterococcus sp. AZ071]
MNTGGAQPDFSNLTPENSRRFRALPAWFTLKAYGKAGYRQLVEQNSAFALELGKRITDSPFFELLSPVRLNGVCFALKDPTKTTEFLKKVNQAGQVFLTPTTYKKKPAIRASFSNWQTKPADVAIIWHSLEADAQQL